MSRSRLAAVLAACLALAGCSLGLEDLPAPAGTNGATYRVTAEFGDVQNLTYGAKVKLGGVVIGEVDSISTRDFHAFVKMDIEKKFALGKDARMQIRFTTPLGEDFVSVQSAGHPQHGTLADGGAIPFAATSSAPNIEDTFSAVSLLINGGGLSKLQTIATELDAAFKGRTGSARDALINLHKVISNLDDHKVDIDATLDGLEQMARELNSGTGVVEQALALFPSTFETLTAQTARLRTLLAKVGRLGVTVDGMLARSQSAMLADLDNLRPTLAALNARQGELIPTFQALTKLGASLRRAAPGDYLNIDATIEFLLEAPPARPNAGGSRHPEADAVTRLLTNGLTEEAGG